jgi:hypothetical protein
MSAPATRVFLRPVALMLAAAGARGGLRPILARGQALYGLAHGLTADARAAAVRRDPFVRLAAWLACRAEGVSGAPKLLVELSPGWEGLAPWIEQLVEESLGKAGKGFLVFHGQSAHAAYGDECAVLRIAVEGFGEPRQAPWSVPTLTLRVPSLEPPALPAAARGLGELAGLFLGLKLTVAAYGYLQDIVFAGQPAVEAYKKYARALRDAPGPVRLDRGASGQTGGAHRVTSGPLHLDISSLVRSGRITGAQLSQALRRFGGDRASPADVFAAVLDGARRAGALRYLDLTWNGEMSDGVRGALMRARERLANGTLGIPAKVRTGPSDYHSTEQGETDGPPELVSLRLVAERHAPVAAGDYDDRFLLAQARGTWLAMEDAGRWIVFATLPEAGDTPAGREAMAALNAFFDRATMCLAKPTPRE